MGDMQLRASSAAIQDGEATLAGLGGDTEALRDRLKSAVTAAIGNLNDGEGVEQHGAVMKKADDLITKYINSITQAKTSTMNVGDTFAGAGQRMKSILGSGSTSA